MKLKANCQDQRAANAQKMRSLTPLTRMDGEGRTAGEWPIGLPMLLTLLTGPRNRRNGHFTHAPAQHLTHPSRRGKVASEAGATYAHNFFPLPLVHIAHGVYNSHVAIVRREVYECEVCKWQWIPRGKQGLPTHCPNRECRSRRWNGEKADSRTNQSSGVRPARVANGGVRLPEGRVVDPGAVADVGGVREVGPGLGLKECPDCGGRMLENRKQRLLMCMDEQCNYREPIH